MVTQQDYKDAILVLDACNLCGIAQSFAEVMKRIRAQERDTNLANSHPIARLYAEKIMELTLSGQGLFSYHFEEAYKECQKQGAQ